MRALYTVLFFLVASFTGYAQVAQVQFIHAAADPELELVDVYVNGQLELENFSYTSATAFSPVVAETDLEIGIAKAPSTGVVDTVTTFLVRLDQNAAYHIFISGVMERDSFLPNPQGRDIGLSFVVHPLARMAAVDSGEVDFFFYNGVTDAEPLYIVNSGGQVLANDLDYQQRTQYYSGEPGAYLFYYGPDYGTYQLTTWGFGGEAGVVFTTGFSDSLSNQQGPNFQVMAAFGDGTVVPLTQPGIARVQFIHNAPDPRVDTVDFIIENQPYFDDMSYLSATPYLSFPADSLLTVKVTSADGFTTIYTGSIELEAGKTYAAVLAGVLPPLDSLGNPVNDSLELEILSLEGSRELSGDPNEVALAVQHGVPDAAPYDVWLGSQLVANSLSFKGFSQPEPVDAQTYPVSLSHPDLPDEVYVEDHISLDGHGGQGGILLLSGFTGALPRPMRLAVVWPDGTVESQIVTGLGEEPEVQPLAIYPNPAQDELTLKLPRQGQWTVRLVNVQGQQVLRKELSTQQQQTLSLQELPQGIYLLNAVHKEGAHYRAKVMVY